MKTIETLTAEYAAAKTAAAAARAVWAATPAGLAKEEAWEDAEVARYGADKAESDLVIAKRPAPKPTTAYAGRMLCGACGDNVPCRKTPNGWRCADC